MTWKGFVIERWTEVSRVIFRMLRLSSHDIGAPPHRVCRASAPLSRARQVMLDRQGMQGHAGYNVEGKVVRKVR